MLIIREDFSIQEEVHFLTLAHLNRNFTRESDLERLQRLEMQAFGAVQQGDINTRYDNVRNAILSRPKNNYRTSLIRNIGNFFGGQLTGFTPSFNSSFDDDPFLQ